ncbi:hypothetical protein [Pseudoalteromonas sp. T1lg24]|nr:hypothetical protein [Pseudoalteromonas sp. T1lg24]
MAKDALSSGKNIKDLVLEKGILSESQLADIMQPDKLTEPA